MEAMKKFPYFTLLTVALVLALYPVLGNKSAYLHQKCINASQPNDTLYLSIKQIKLDSLLSFLQSDSAFLLYADSIGIEHNYVICKQIKNIRFARFSIFILRKDYGMNHKTLGRSAHYSYPDSIRDIYNHFYDSLFNLEEKNWPPHHSLYQTKSVLETGPYIFDIYSKAASLLLEKEPNSKLPFYIITALCPVRINNHVFFSYEITPLIDTFSAGFESYKGYTCLLKYNSEDKLVSSYSFIYDVIR